MALAKTPTKHAAKPVAKPITKGPAKPTLPDPSTAAPAAKTVTDDGIPRAKPIGNPADWFPADAYPPEARNAGQEGRTAFSVKVDAQGRLVECDIVQSSGSAQLDNTTCDLIVTHGRFSPARDAAGHPVAGVWRSAMRWQLVTGPSTLDSE
ncbi:energy transducer TonB [Sphingomonas sp. GlSt437]|uniref:energy transducer TonB n=1 Tax=Sphingomonas sp. GlSt437 TaxID=3389970 RepID=UPI003EC01A3B